MEKVVLPNGLTAIYAKRKGPSVVVEVMVKVGSNHETPHERGISHFLEHILFEGTESRPTNRDISNEIERIGGDFNAYTTNERTCFYVKVLRKHFPIAVEILADIIQHALCTEKDIHKEKNVVLKEIDMVNDEPRFYQWVLFQRTLFHRYPTKYPTYGNRNVIRSLTRKKVVQYFNKYYPPNNMVVCVVGSIPNWRKEVAKRFTFLPQKVSLPKMPEERPAQQPQEKRERKKINNTYLVLGFKTVPRTHPDSYTLEVINGILGRGQSGRMFTEIRAKRGLAYEVGTQHTAESCFGYFAVYATIDKANRMLVKKLILKELEKVKNASADDIREAKEYVEGDYYLQLEDPQKIADQILFWEQAKDAALMKEFIARVKKVTPADIQRVVKTYFRNHTLVVVEGK